MSGVYLNPLGLQWKEVNAASGKQFQNATLEALLQKATAQVVKLDLADYDKLKASGGLPAKRECYVKVGQRIYQPDLGPDVSKMRKDDLALQVSGKFLFRTVLCMRTPC